MAKGLTDFFWVLYGFIYDSCSRLGVQIKKIGEGFKLGLLSLFFFPQLKHIG